MSALKKELKKGLLYSAKCVTVLLILYIKIVLCIIQMVNLINVASVQILYMDGSGKGGAR